ncbi:transaldolase [Nitratifractor salsuginis]|uniref:Transaldolase n=1 Tax=Nitratifractor salsuginis (strain DSM 16511 / JCM 12458 / E9I37-1) TaxID=749222 RepID=E6WZH9_NITSE|nr:transaldolase [Nitratifractor salsuginis]ADV45559.1 transaldolase [Nitratifractor salsuginis DSM 16511]
MIDDNIGFSLWLDFIERDFLRHRFVEMVERRIVNGATSNPSIFAQAISTSPAYEEALEELKGLSPKAKYEKLAIEDIKSAAIALRGVYDEGSEGYVSIEVDPFLANDTEGTIAEARRLFAEIDEPNVMIKIPATEAGYPAMQALLADGISVNATLVFSPMQTRACLDAMKIGIDEFENTGGERVEAVISVFVSRFDRLLDPRLKEAGLPVGRTGIMNASKIYNIIEANHTPSIRTLFASTGVKAGQPFPADYYIRELYGPHCVNTAPLETIEAFEKGEAPIVKLPRSEEEIEAYFQELGKHGIIMDAVYAQLMAEGLEAFENAFAELLKKLEA